MGTVETTRIAVIGAAKWSHEEDDLQINCIDWNTAFSAINLRDYDVWVLYVDSLPHTIATDSILDSLTPAYLYRALLDGLRVYVLGDPRADLRFEATAKSKPFLDWTGYRFNWDTSLGTISNKQPDYCRTYLVDKYLSTFSNSAYALQNVEPSQLFTIAKKPIDGTEDCSLQLQWLLATRYKCHPAFALGFFTWSRAYPGIPAMHGEIVFVPSTHIGLENALRVFIQSLYGVELGNDIPVWLDALTVPGQELLDADIDKLTNALVKTETALEIKQSERDNLRACLAVLYQSGPALDVAVKKLLVEMGAQITESTKSGNEDGWIAVDLGGEILEGVLEIKSVRKANFDIDGLRQVNDWVQAALLSKGKRFKGIFIGNHLINKEPSQRTDPFSSQWKSRSELFNVAALSTTTLFDAYRQIKEGHLHAKKFWQRLFQTSGIFQLSDKSD